MHAAAGHIKAAAGLGAVLGAIEVHHALASGDIPMLKPMLMALQRQALAGFEPQPLDEITLPFGEGFVPTPGTSAALHRLLLAGLRAGG
mgnify:CR=1 FL=1